MLCWLIESRTTATKSESRLSLEMSAARITCVMSVSSYETLRNFKKICAIVIDAFNKLNLNVSANIACSPPTVVTFTNPSEIWEKNAYKCSSTENE